MTYRRMSSDREHELENQHDIIAGFVTAAVRTARRNGKELVYDNQEEAVNEIMTHYINGKRCVLLVAQPGIGKTGAAHGTMIRYAQHATLDQAVLTKDMFLCTGMSDTEWKRQFEKNIIDPFHDNIAHRGVIAKFEEKLANTTNSLVVDDECHIACGPSMVVGRTMRSAGLMDIDELEKRNIRLLKISATPEAVLRDLQAWGSKGAMVVLKPGQKYKGFRTMLDENRIRNSPGLDTYQDVEVLFNLLEDRYRSTTKKYFIFRITHTETRMFLERAANIKGWEHKYHDSVDRVEDIDKMMEHAPKKHTAIIIKEFWRASKRLIRDHVGATYEPITKIRNSTVTSQGLTARFCDNFEYTGDWLNPSLRPLHFCDMGAIIEYMDWVDVGYDYSLTQAYQGGALKAKDGRVKTRPTMIHPDYVDNLDAIDLPVPRPSDRHMLSQIFESLDAAKKWTIEKMSAGSSQLGLFNETGNPRTTLSTATHYADYYRVGHHAPILEASANGNQIADQDRDRIRRGLSHTGAKSRIMPVRIDGVVKCVVVYLRDHLKPIV